MTNSKKQDVMLESDVAGDVPSSQPSLAAELFRYALLIGMGGLIALLSSYLVRQFGY